MCKLLSETVFKPPMTQAIAVMTTLPDYETALKLAAELVEKRLAACVNILPSMTSVYEWKGKLEKGREHLLLIKTTERCYLDLEAYIRRFHPYELPEIIAVPVKSGLSAYLDWVRMQTVE
jgi:periplasmic divalent cation tolerance protein